MAAVGRAARATRVIVPAARALSTPPPPPLPSHPFHNFSPTPPTFSHPNPPNGERPDAPVHDAEWEIRVGRGMLHLRETLPRLFDPSLGSDDLFPREVFSPHVVLKLPSPFPIRIPGLTAYRMAFATGRSGLHALHTDLATTLQRMTFSPPQAPHSLADGFKDTPAVRHRQIRVMLSLHGIPRLPPHHCAEWTTSNLYTFNPYSGLIASHEVEAIRPLPGEGVGEWVKHRLLGWTRQAEPAGPVGFSVKIEDVRR
ncbi:hypothetical protein CcaverHIS002_0303320 [Cutaneotrichosporon cavernicola]|uniref:Uncharacterized protein n=1 Tax=Cutaneotrichosporon cavernicola TaxID=279322 RepID=A0AA48L290_9TREE|nr:uncharacterized protein CcaverHIS019_0303320 [Cutaneotrichosporon cavernicola]BEI82464.1 hypothetical protein CcaverHIS002_0303320 [Cutaneotrichosporon cavernicola]BEI90262.1 hypothetical protein CcaverHIS019_0303320 [Cutaneotrichosporon cavernicola]BEI98039.1 hypothetical protein CcaverHIS631_0303380 [Cutaneotrichosporon cavernicola]BEJ05816.1 hypothetical protein CcaverHIS641_0303380 [Cutaneotrichosporon cavernicola]